MQSLFSRALFTRRWPAWAAYLSATVITMAALVLRLWSEPHLQGYPVLLFFPAIIVSAVLFDRGCGFYSTLLSAAFAAYFVLQPTSSFAVASWSDLLGLTLFMLIGLVTAAMIEVLHGALFDLEQAHARLRASEQQKDLLLREASHRVRNDLTTLTALVRLQMRTVEHEAARSVLAATADRLQVLARVHERLRRDESTATVSTSDFLHGLCQDLRTSMVGLRPVVMRTEIEDHEMAQDHAVSVGLIANECLTNALKYAFPDDRTGTVSIRFAREGDTYILSVKDDGVGMAFKHPERSRGTGLGQRLVRSMVTQLEGTLDIDPDDGTPGTVITVRFPAR